MHFLMQFLIAWNPDLSLESKLYLLPKDKTGFRILESQIVKLISIEVQIKTESQYRKLPIVSC